MSEQRQSIAVVGGGVSGIVSAYLLSRRFDVTLYERSHYLGGHTNTIEITAGPDKGIAVDTGFIVLNDRTYPNFHRFLEQLKVPVRYADMSFSFSCEHSGLEYCSRTVAALFAQRRNLLNPRFLKMLYDVPRFWKVAEADLASGTAQQKTLREWLTHHKLTGAVASDYLIPISAAIWSSPDTQLMDFPAHTFLHFFKNHGLLGYLDQPRWQTVVGGSFQYVKTFTAQFSGTLRLSTAVRSIRPEGAGVVVTDSAGESKHYDHAVIAAHADEVLPLLENASGKEREIFSPWGYQKNHTVLHTDTRLLPRTERAWASWNYRRELGEDGSKPVSVTYYMNGLQGFAAEQHYCVTLNPRTSIDPQKVIYEVTYTHPCYTVAAVAARDRIATELREGHLHFVGSYFGFGFHEDAVSSAVRMAQRFGIEL
ncbi:MAG: FAD-dependent oxidoreductase [Proteobacteria bacterium]|nr:FAD-dependent oxidoreductase [Pseudomonadota bacterium]